jgi:DNA transposition AAA+ family ATPase
LTLVQIQIRDRHRDDFAERNDLKRVNYSRLRFGTRGALVVVQPSPLRNSNIAVSDPTTLILVDEADRLQMNSLEQMRSIFDEGTAGMVLIGMPGIENRIARFPQFYSRIGFVHEFRPLDANQVQELLE